MKAIREFFFSATIWTGVIVCIVTQCSKPEPCHDHVVDQVDVVERYPSHQPYFSMAIMRRFADNRIEYLWVSDSMGAWIATEDSVWFDPFAPFDSLITIEIPTFMGGNE
jgi:hypothetical protein